MNTRYIRYIWYIRYIRYIARLLADAMPEMNIGASPTRERRRGVRRRLGETASARLGQDVRRLVSRPVAVEQLASTQLGSRSLPLRVIVATTFVMSTTVSTTPTRPCRRPLACHALSPADLRRLLRALDRRSLRSVEIGRSGCANGWRRLAELDALGAAAPPAGAPP